MKTEYFFIPEIHSGIVIMWEAVRAKSVPVTVCRVINHSYPIDKHLSDLGLPVAYAQLFNAECLKMEHISTLTDKDLQMLGLKMGQRRDFMQSIEDGEWSSPLITPMHFYRPVTILRMVTDCLHRYGNGPWQVTICDGRETVDTNLQVNFSYLVHQNYTIVGEKYTWVIGDRR